MAKLSKLKQRLIAEQEQEMKWQAAIKFGTKKTNDHKWNKRETDSKLAQKIYAPPLSGYVLRAEDEYKPKSYNKEKQLYEMVRHAYVKYNNAPLFLYDEIIGKMTKGSLTEAFYTVPVIHAAKHGPSAYGHRLHDTVDWFLTIVQGGSFQKKVKHIMNKHEANLFLKGRNDKTVVENIWYAKMKHIEMPPFITDRIIDRIFRNVEHNHNNYESYIECMNMFKRIAPDLNKENIGEIIDYVQAVVHRPPEGFSGWKGRTFSSIVKLANEWHRVQVVLASNGKQGFVEWTGMGLPEWHKTIPTVPGAATRIEVTELTSSRGLMDEGSKQNHCVGSYVRMCAQGQSHIFTMRFYLAKRNPEDHVEKWSKVSHLHRLTIEVRDRRIQQVKGKSNRPATDEEKRIVKEWAGEKGLSSGSYW